MSIRVSDAARALDALFPSWWAEPWDRVGLLIGDPDAVVSRAYVALDATVETVREAADNGCELLVTHHPPFLGDLPRAVAADPVGRIVVESCRLGVAVVSLHTNLDRSPQGWRALPQACGFDSVTPLERSSEEADLVTVYAPERAEQTVVDAMAGAGAGRIGQYERCFFAATGIGGFAPLPGALPVEGGGGPASVPEVRIEMVAPPGRGHAVASVARDAHPYEEPLITVTRIHRPRAQAALGALAVTSPTTLGHLVERVSSSLGVAVRVWGDRNTRVERVAFANGSGGALIADAIASGAHALVTGEVRYHDAQRAVENGLAVVEAGHDATELPLVSVIAAALRDVLGDERVVVRPGRTTGWWVTRT